MTYDDTQNTHDEPLSALCRDLSDALYQPAVDADMLRRQAHLLDQIMYRLMRDRVGASLETGAYLERWLDLSLRIQKQCVETVRTAEAADYMRNISVSKKSPRPLRHIPVEQTEENR